MLDLSRLYTLAGIITEASQLDEAIVDTIAQQQGPAIMLAYSHDTGFHGQKFDNALDIVKYIADKTLPPQDPSPNYTKKIINWYINGQFKLEDVSRVQGYMTRFVEVKNKLAQKNINDYKNVEDLLNALKQIENSDVQSKTAAKKEIKSTGATKLVDTPNFKVIIPLTQEASCEYGAGTEWCTAATKSENRFDQYNSQGKLYIIIAGNRKFQLHMETSSFMDENDQPIKAADISLLSKIPAYKDFLNYLIKTYYE
jgi:hypothetical protein